MQELNIKIVTESGERFSQMGFDIVEISDVLSYCHPLDEIGFDVEATGLGFMFSDLWCLQVGDANTQFVIDLQTIDILEFKDLLQEKTLIGHYLIYDIVFLYKHGILPSKVYDIYLAEYLCSAGVRKYGRTLADCAERYLSVHIPKEDRAEVAEKGLTTKESVIYSARDVRYLHQIKEAQQESVKRFDVAPVVDLENRHILALAYIEFCGVYINKKQLLKWCRLVEYEEYDAWLKLNAYVEENHPQVYLPEFEDNFNWGSPKQVIELFQEIGIDTWDTKKQSHSVDAKFIKKQGKNFPVIELYLHWREKNKSVTTYGRNWFEYIQDDGRIHTKYKPMVETGRLASGDTSRGRPFPNMLNLPKDNKFRRIIEGEGPNRLIICDYSGQESVINADFSKEPALLAFYKSGEADLHSYVAKQIWADELGDLTLEEIKTQHKDKRQAAKSVTFALAYAGNEFTIAENAGISLAEAKVIYDKYFKAFPHLKEYFTKAYRQAMKKGWVQANPVSKRKRFLEGMRQYAERGQRDWKFESMVNKAALNTPCQATGADMIKEATIMLFDSIKAEKRFGKDKIINSIYDELVVETNGRRAEKMAQLVKECMETAGNKYLSELTIQAEPEISKHWKK